MTRRTSGGRPRARIYFSASSASLRFVRRGSSPARSIGSLSAPSARHGRVSLVYCPSCLPSPRTILSPVALALPALPAIPAPANLPRTTPHLCLPGSPLTSPPSLNGVAQQPTNLVACAALTLVAHNWLSPNINLSSEFSEVAGFSTPPAGRMGRGQAPKKQNLNELKQELEIDVHKVILSAMFLT